MALTKELEECRKSVSRKRLDLSLSKVGETLNIKEITQKVSERLFSQSIKN